MESLHSLSTDHPLVWFGEVGPIVTRLAHQNRLCRQTLESGAIPPTASHYRPYRHIWAATSEPPNDSFCRILAVLARLQLQRRSATNANMTQTRVMSADRGLDLDRFDLFDDLDAGRTDDPGLYHRILEPGICDEGVEGVK